MKLARNVVATVVALALVGGCVSSDDDVAGPGSDPSTTASPDPSDPPDTTGGSTTGPERAPVEISWTDCDGFECGTALVPLDHDDPDGDTFEIGMLRVPARDPERRIGTLFVNPGGPGGSASETAAALAPGLPGEVRDRFDIVGLDPRGVGLSGPVNCSEGVVDMYAADPTFEDQGDVDAYLDVSGDFVESCTGGNEAVFANMGTVTIARDMDLVRQALGDEGLTYLGYSYGTSIGQVYADLFPERIRAMVLDGVVDLSKSGVDGAAAQAAGFEVALDRWAADCDADPSCPVTGRAEAALDAVTATAEQAPIPAPLADRPAGPGDVSVAVSGALYSEGLWRSLSGALADAEGGDGSALVELADRYLGFGDFGVYFGVSCVDSEWPDAPDLFAAGKAAAAESPHFGEAIVNDYVRCSLWPVPPEPVRASDGAGSPPIVVVSTTGDPATPYQAGVDLAERLPDGRLISYEGDGHTVTFNGVRCVDDAVTAYLVDLDLPDADTRC